MTGYGVNPSAVTLAAHLLVDLAEPGTELTLRWASRTRRGGGPSTTMKCARSE
jgi:hypothetical protein